MRPERDPAGDGRESSPASPLVGHYFVLTDLETGRLVAHAMICPEARYASARWRVPGMVEHRRPAAVHWAAVEADLRIGWEKGLVDGDSATAMAIIPAAIRSDLRAQKVSEVFGATPEGAARVFDRFLLMQRFC